MYLDNEILNRVLIQYQKEEKAINKKIEALEKKINYSPLDDLLEISKRLKKLNEGYEQKEFLPKAYLRELGKLRIIETKANKAIDSPPDLMKLIEKKTALLLKLSKNQRHQGEINAHLFYSEKTKPAARLVARKKLK